MVIRAAAIWEPLMSLSIHANFLRAIVILPVVLVSNCLKETGRFRRLEPDKTIFNEVLSNHEAASYQLDGLLSNTNYEIRISYPAVVPTDFVIRILWPDQQSRIKSRQILNIEKTTFKTDHTTKGYVAEIIAYRTGFPYDDRRLKDPVVYNIVLETLHFGLSLKSWLMVCYAFILCIVSFKYFAPLLYQYMIVRIKKEEHQS
ncbi:uncharacterized protein LOC135682817 [Rhopilema esculentum]|uniref:uncharacterized protein LOC135682817 n=1 Tax=Rhopilema esculentum TaxID=499914 RepID=UPI0031CE8596